MIDPLAQIVSLLNPQAPHSKVSTGAGRWIVQRAGTTGPFYCAVLAGECRLTCAGGEKIPLQAGDFILVPSADAFEMASAGPSGPEDIIRVPVELPNGEHRIGASTGPHDVRMLIGYCEFGSPDAALLVSLLPRFIHVRGRTRSTTLLHMLGEEVGEKRPARDIVMMRLLDVLFIEALRTAAETTDGHGLLHGLADERVSMALRLMHSDLTGKWTVPRLAKEAGISRSAFFERFRRVMGIAPMEYLLTWRMAVAKDRIRRQNESIAEVAQHVGYSSANTFSIAFTRHVGTPPSVYAQQA